MQYNYSQTYKTSKDVLDFHQYRLSHVHQTIINQEIWAILEVDERAGKKFFMNDPILELGIGGGVISNNLQVKLQNSNLVGLDVSRKMLEACKANLSHYSQARDASLIVGDIFHLPFRSSSLNSVITVRLIPNLVENDLALKEVARILKPGGQIIFDIYNKMSIMSLIDNVVHLFLRRRPTTYKHTCDLNQVISTCESTGIPVQYHVECLLLPEALFKFAPKQLLRKIVSVDRIVSKLPLFSKISTRIFLLSRKRKQ